MSDSTSSTTADEPPASDDEPLEDDEELFIDLAQLPSDADVTNNAEDDDAVDDTDNEVDGVTSDDETFDSSTVDVHVAFVEHSGEKRAGESSGTVASCSALWGAKAVSVLSDRSSPALLCSSRVVSSRVFSTQAFVGPDSVYCLACNSAFDDVVVSGGGDDVAMLWSLDDGMLAHTLRGHTDSVVCCGFNYTGELVATGGLDNCVKVWRVSTGELLQTLDGPADGIQVPPARAALSLSSGRSGSTGTRAATCCWPAPTTARCGCGWRPPARSCARLSATLVP